jgi:calcineurin-like phosphoesterase family protein
MTYWVIADTHFGHESIKEWGDRPDGYENKIMNSLKTVRKGDVFIHLGDIAFKNESEWCETMLALVGPDVKKWLVRGNHDKRGDGWYFDRGFDFVGEMAWLNRWGKKVLFSHRPVADLGYDINIHGHLHGTGHRNDEYVLTDKHVLVKCEHDYRPYNVEGVLK